MILIDEPPVTMLCSVVSASVIVVYIVIDVRLDDVHACMSGRRTSIYKVVKVRLRARTDVCFCEMIFVNFVNIVWWLATLGQIWSGSMLFNNISIRNIKYIGTTALN